MSIDVCKVCHPDILQKFMWLANVTGGADVAGYATYTGQVGEYQLSLDNKKNCRMLIRQRGVAADIPINHCPECGRRLYDY